MPASTVASRISQAWYQASPWLILLLPLSWLFMLVSGFKRWLYQAGIAKQWKAPVPVIVIGNISVGGTGKTPLVVSLVEHLKNCGFKPGVISRGYGSRANTYPFIVTPDGLAESCGDEPLLIARRTGVPVVIDANRPRAARHLLDQFSCDVILSDDGLQHYALARTIECVVVDGQRGLGNRYCLPAGPLREHISRLETVDLVVSNGTIHADIDSFNPHLMSLVSGKLVNLKSSHNCSLDQWQSKRRVHAIAGIGNPDRFFESLKALGFDVIEHPYDDHYDYTQKDIQFNDDLPVIMTEKDAVKIAPFATEHCWYLPVNANLDDRFYSDIIDQLTLFRQRTLQ